MTSSRWLTAVATAWTLLLTLQIMDPIMADNLLQKKIGLAPHERPTCQLSPSPMHRRHSPNSSTGPGSNTALLGERTDATSGAISSTNNNNSNNASGGSISASITQSIGDILAPSVVSLNAESGGLATSFNSRLGNTQKSNTSERLRQLRQLLASNNYDAYLVTPNDEHGSEIVAESDKRLRFITGFTGSNGYALILLERAVFFTDGRYAIQADQELDCNWWLVVGDDPLADMIAWFKVHAPSRGLKVATDARLLSLQNYDFLDTNLRAHDCELALISQDLVDVVWEALDSASKQVTRQMIYVHASQFTGNVSWQEKTVRLADQMAKLKANSYVLSKLDDIGWLLNLRGSDVPDSPLFKGFLFVSRLNTGAQISQRASAGSTSELLLRQSSPDSLQAPQVLQLPIHQIIKLTLYVNLNQVDQKVRDHLQTDNGTLVMHPGENGTQMSSKIVVELRDYDVFVMEFREKLSAPIQRVGRILLDASSNVAIHVLAKNHEDRIILVEGLVQKMKSIKTDAEVQGMRAAHWRDSLAISMLLAQLDLDIERRGLVNKWTETGAAQELAFFRSLMDYNRGQSFPTISAYGSRSAIVHYMPNPNEQRLIGNQSTYLLDCGAQYLDGTTDITRTLHYGEPTDFQRETYTRVLMGAIDMMSLVVDESVRILNDLMARRYLHEIGLDYMHGTGHGIGLFSMCHEAPALIEHFAKRPTGCTSVKGVQVISDPVGVRANMFSSVEPGYYKTDDFGIRLENIIVTQKVTPMPASNRKLLRLEPISLVPFEPKLIKFELLSNKQKSWLNSYNLMVRLRLTQQINYYLAKIRAHREQSLQANSQQHQLVMSGRSDSGPGTSPSNLTQSSSSTVATTNSWIKLLEPAQFEEKLELAHKWIIAKTELISLDVPRGLMEQMLSGSVEKPAKPEKQLAKSSSGANKKLPELERLDSQRLMLFYMSSPPFNDQDASEALTQLSARSNNNLAATTSSNNQTTTSDTSPATIGAGASKCTTGYQCDLWLASALQPHPISGASREQRLIGSGAPLGSWSSLDELQPAGSDGDLAGSIMELFHLSPHSSNASLVPNMWSLTGFGLLLVVQLALVAFVCRRSGSRRRQVAFRPAPTALGPMVAQANC